MSLSRLHGFAQFRRGVAILCMALAVMLSGQAYISLMDRIDHTHHHVHFPNPLAGDLQFCSGDACGAHHHHDGNEVAGDHPHAHEAAGGHQHTHNPADHQHGDAAIVFLAAQSFILVACPAAEIRCGTDPPALVSISSRGPDHPPKPSLEIRV